MSKRKKKTNNGGHNTTQKTKDRATWASQKQGKSQVPWKS